MWTHQWMKMAKMMFMADGTWPMVDGIPQEINNLEANAKNLLWWINYNR